MSYEHDMNCLNRPQLISTQLVLTGYQHNWYLYNGCLSIFILSFAPVHIRWWCWYCLMHQWLPSKIWYADWSHCSCTKQTWSLCKMRTHHSPGLLADMTLANMCLCHDVMMSWLSWCHDCHDVMIVPLCAGLWKNAWCSTNFHAIAREELAHARWDHVTWLRITVPVPVSAPWARNLEGITFGTLADVQIFFKSQ